MGEPRRGDVIVGAGLPAFLRARYLGRGVADGSLPQVGGPTFGATAGLDSSRATWASTA